MKKLLLPFIAFLIFGIMSSCSKDGLDKDTKKIEFIRYEFGSYLQWFWDNGLVNRIEYNSNYSNSREICNYSYDSQEHYLTANFTYDGVRFEYEYSSGNISQIDVYLEDNFVGKYIFSYNNKKISNIKLISIDSKKAALPFPKSFNKILKSQKDDFVVYDISYKWDRNNVKEVNIKCFDDPDELDYMAIINYEYDQGHNPFYCDWGFPLTEDGFIDGLYLPFYGMPFNKNNCIKMTIETTEFYYEEDETSSNIITMEYSYDEDLYPTMVAVFYDNSLEEALRFNYLEE